MTRGVTFDEVENLERDKKMKKAAHGGMNRPFIKWIRKKLWRYNNA
jgi:hypothetical protein